MNERRSGYYRGMIGACHVLGLAGVLLLAGCGGGDATAPVTGTVTYKGQPVKGGSLQFLPQGGKDNPNPGKPAAAAIKDDGTYSMTTNREGDGAIIGRHKVTYSAPVGYLDPAKNPKPGDTPPPSGYEGLSVKTPEVEVKSGQNKIDIELKK